MNLYMFDFYGVISNEIAVPWFRKHFDSKTADSIKEKYFIPADLGEYDCFGIAKKIADETGFSYEDILAGWRNEAGLNEKLLEIILELRKNNKVALVSNAAVGFREYLYPNLDLNKYFDKVYISGYYHIAKPDLKFYNMCLSSFDEEFESIYMIDDNMKNLVVLKDTKIQPILFRSNEDVINIAPKMK